ncbi:MAG: hypothetical protein JWO72_1698 [Caulobacteraceae bacterium]|nr:hypothetical protein [Caulobacteraceae bacterium]
MDERTDAAGRIATGFNGRGGMPAFEGHLDDVALSAILSSAWGNTAGPVAPAEVAAIRAGAAAAPPKSTTVH